MISREEVAKIAHLGRLNLSEEELEIYTGQLSHILDYVAKLQELDTSQVEPKAHAVERTNVFRGDELKRSLPTKEALANAPDHDEFFFRVPTVLE